MKNTFLVCAAIVAVFIGMVLVLDPSFADILCDEDGLFENITILMYGAAFASSLALFFIRYKKRSGYRFWLFFSILMFIFAGEEVDWLKRSFKSTRYTIAGIAFDGIHDLLSVSIGIIQYVRDYIISIGILNIKSIAIIISLAIVIVSLASLLINALIRNKKKLQEFFSKNLRWEPFFFLTIGIILLIIALVIDDDNLVGFPHKSVVEEPMEFIAATSFLFSCLTGIKETKNLKRKT